MLYRFPDMKINFHFITRYDNNNKHKKEKLSDEESREKKEIKHKTRI